MARHPRTSVIGAIQGTLVALLLSIVGATALAQATPDEQQTSAKPASDDATDVSPAKTDAEWKPSLASPRDTFVTFLKSIEDRDYETAVSALDFSQVMPEPDVYQQIKIALRLHACLDRLPVVAPVEISAVQEGEDVPVPPDSEDSAIIISRVEGAEWKFSAETTAGVESIYSILKELHPTVAKAPATTAPTSPPDAASATPDATPSTDVREKPTPAVPENLRSARRVVRTLLNSFDDRDYPSAIATLDFSAMQSEDPEISQFTRLGYARRLKEIMERLALIDYAEISDDPNGPPFLFPPDETNQPIEIDRDSTGVWRFTANTVGRIDALHDIYKNKPIVNVPEDEKPWYDRELILGNETWRILALFVSIFASLFLGQMLRMLFKWRSDSLRDSGHTLRSYVSLTVSKAAVGLAFLLGISLGMRGLVLEHDVQTLVTAVIRVVVSLVIGYICFRLVDVAVELLKSFAKRSGSTLNDMLVPIVSASLRLTIVVLVGLEIATAISDQPPSAIVAGLGAGGLAIGLAAQDTVKNLFGSVMIFADRPFELGDRIVIDGHDGPVERVGFRSTRIRTLDGHLVTIPNGEMANRTIHNIGKRPYIRRVMNIRIAYDASPDQLRLALGTLRELLTDHEGMQEDLPPRVFLHDFLDNAFNIRAIYWFHPPAYWDYCDFGERLNLQIAERFRAAGIDFALPAQRLLVQNESTEP